MHQRFLNAITTTANPPSFSQHKGPSLTQSHARPNRTATPLSVPRFEALTHHQAGSCMHETNISLFLERPPSILANRPPQMISTARLSPIATALVTQTEKVKHIASRRQLLSSIRSCDHNVCKDQIWICFVERYLSQNQLII